MVDVITSSSAAYQADALTQTQSDGQVLYASQTNQWISDLRSLNGAFQGEEAVTGLWIGSGTGTPDPTADELVVGGTDVTNSGINLLNSSTGAGRIVWGDGDDNNVGAFQYQHNFDQFAWTVAGASELILSSSYLGPATDDGLNLGRSANRFNVAYLTSLNVNNDAGSASGSANDIVYGSTDGTAADVGITSLTDAAGTHRIYFGDDGDNDRHRILVAAGSGGEFQLWPDASFTFGVASTLVRCTTDLEIDGDLDHDGTSVGFFSAAPVAQQGAGGISSGFVPGGGTNVTHTSTFTGNTGTAAYTIGDIVAALKNYGLLASS